MKIPKGEIPEPVDDPGEEFLTGEQLQLLADHLAMSTGLHAYTALARYLGYANCPNTWRRTRGAQGVVGRWLRDGTNHKQVIALYKLACMNKSGMRNAVTLAKQERPDIKDWVSKGEEQ